MEYIVTTHYSCQYPAIFQHDWCERYRQVPIHVLCSVKFSIFFVRKGGGGVGGTAGFPLFDSDRNRAFWPRTSAPCLSFVTDRLLPRVCLKQLSSYIPSDKNQTNLDGDIHCALNKKKTLNSLGEIIFIMIILNAC